MAVEFIYIMLHLIEHLEIKYYSRDPAVY